MKKNKFIFFKNKCKKDLQHMLLNSIFVAQ